MASQLLRSTLRAPQHADPSPLVRQGEDIVCAAGNGGVLEAQNTKGGISRVAPLRPKPQVHSLPPILSEIFRTPISSCSKGSRGLSVFLRVLGIFTETLISPSLSLRQRPTRCAIRAGRNLPDKEFRYLRTVIVTAAVYRGLASVLCGRSH